VMSLLHLLQMNLTPPPEPPEEGVPFAFMMRPIVGREAQ
jgi:hypothetical protein